MRSTWVAALAITALSPSGGSVLLAQNGAVLVGRITSESGPALVTGSVSIEEMRISVSTNTEGFYRIVIPSVRVSGQSVVLRARSLGYLAQTKQIMISEVEQRHDFVLRRDVNRLEEIVVTGTVSAMAQKKLPFSVTKLDSTDMPVPATNVLLQLQGKIPGAHIVQPSGRPGTAPAVVLRGPKSIDARGRSQSPLIIVDGAVLSSVGLQEINSQDVESIEVVRGAAAASLYGSRAGMGVIQITTKSGRRGSEGTRFAVRSEYGFKDVQSEYRYAHRHFLMMDEMNERFCIKVTNQPACSRTVDFEEEARRINDVESPGALQPYGFERDYGIGGAPSKPELKGLFQVNSWPKSYNPVAQVITNGQSVSNSVDASTRIGGTAYFASLSDLAEEGAMRYLRGYRRSSARANVDQIVGESWTIALRSMFARSTQFPALTGSGSSGTDEFFLLQTRVPPSVDLLRRDQLGRLYVRANPLIRGTTLGSNTNPLYDHENTQGQLDIDRFLGSLQTRYAPTTWLAFDATASADRTRTADLFLRDRGYRSTNLNLNEQAGGLGYMQEQSTANLSHNLMLSARANSALGADWRGMITASYSYEQQDAQSSYAYGEALAVPGLATLSNTTTNKEVGSSRFSVRAKGVLTGAQLEYKERYIADALVRYDGSSLFGVDERWHPYFRGSFAWRLSDEPSWPMPRVLSDFKLRASVGTAGARPNVVAQFETFAILAGGQVAARTLGNNHLKPENTLETEYGVDGELFGKYGLSLTYARDITTDQLLLVPAPLASGYPSQWANAGTLDGKTWELSLRVPVITARSLTWNSQLSWDRNRTYMTRVGVPPYYVNLSMPGGGVHFYYASGERYGTMYGRRFASRCSELPAPFDAQCGPGKEWQTNDEGYVVWVGAGHSWRDGVALNLWQAMRPGCVVNGAAIATDGEEACRLRGGTVNAPWGARETHWGMPTLLRDSTSNPRLLPVGNTLPDYHLSMSHTIQWKRLNVFGLLDASVGNQVFNLERQWSYGDFMVRDQDQSGKTTDAAKPLGYHWRATQPVSGAGVGGFYDDLTGNNRTVEDGSYAKLREVSATYDLGALPFVVGQWSISVIGRNLYTWTRYTGWDPEVGANIPAVGSAAIATIAAFQYPPTRAFTLALSGRF